MESGTIDSPAPKPQRQGSSIDISSLFLAVRKRREVFDESEYVRVLPADGMWQR